MFYVKTQANEDTCTTTTITDENTFTTCIDCGHEIQVDLDEVIVDGRLDLFGTGLRCEDCSYKHALRNRGEPWAEQLIADYKARRGT